MNSLNLSPDFLRALESATARDSVLSFDHAGIQYVVTPLDEFKEMVEMAGGNLRYVSLN